MRNPQTIAVSEDKLTVDAIEQGFEDLGIVLARAPGVVDRLLRRGERGRQGDDRAREDRRDEAVEADA